MSPDNNEGFRLIQAILPAQIEEARTLFLEYANSLNFSLCFQSFDEELQTLPGAYAPPDGRLLLAQGNGKTAGCVALRKIETDICEMKRLYVRPGYRGTGLGKKLVEELIVEARKIGYTRMRLDTVGESMKDAVALYRRLGFKDIAPYREYPLDGVLYMELDITQA